jgi:hypothetical protein
MLQQRKSFEIEEFLPLGKGWFKMPAPEEAAGTDGNTSLAGTCGGRKSNKRLFKSPRSALLSVGRISSREFLK